MYKFAEQKDYIPGNYRICGMVFTYENGSIANVASPVAEGKIAEDIREGKIAKIEIEIR